MSGRDPDAPIPANFQCPYAEPGQQACPAWRCDCFVATHPDDPFGLHPEDFTVAAPAPPHTAENDALTMAWAQGVADAGARLCAVVAGELGPDHPIVDRMVERLGSITPPPVWPEPWARVIPPEKP